ncbi:M9 family metallopeptidase [Glutamicibacter sp.]|uniref:M9 family metallopeptidase n=1 Tax=Glutamicibacter sp. TaxID=1931995 RepID=UPI0028BD401B|nr:M9 family metallopeptidase [Glutamicibacter sp.]
MQGLSSSAPARRIAAAVSIAVLGLSLTSGIAPALAEKPTADQGSEKAQSIEAPSFIQGEYSPELDPVLSDKDAPRPLVDMKLVEKSQKDKQKLEKKQLKSKKSSSGPEASLGAAGACDSGAIANQSGSGLVQAVKEADFNCVNSLFNATGATAKDLFNQADMLTVAQAFMDDAANYDGSNSASTLQLVLYLRAGYFVQFYQSDTVGGYGPELKALVGDALEKFFANPKSKALNEDSAQVLGEAVTLIDSSENNARFLSVLVDLLQGFNAEREASWNFRNATNNVFTVLFRGHQFDGFSEAVAANPQVLDTLHKFAVDHLDLMGTESDFLVANSGRELARFLGDEQLKPTVKPKVIDLLSRTSMTGDTAKLWVGLADMVNYYDEGNCSDYGTCDLSDKLRTAVLSQNRECSPSINFNTQSVSTDEFGESCTSLKAQDEYFYKAAGTKTPVADDVNTTIDVNVFSSSSDYQTYAGAIFGIDTNNGGMYLEGDPSKAGNEPAFIAYEAEWLKPTFHIWNLNHEYTHYLDGRFDMYGDFGAGLTVPTIWWVEGFAEYVNYGYRGEDYTAANQLAAQKTYKLSEIFDNTYENSGQDRIYRWGYLAVNFMLNKHPQQMQTILSYYRTGKWQESRNYLKNSIGTNYDAEFSNFLDTCAAGNCKPPVPTDPVDPTDPETCPETTGQALTSGCTAKNLSGTKENLNYFYIYVPEGTAELQINTSGGTGNADLFYSPSNWAGPNNHNYRSTESGNNESITVPNPPGGYNYISLSTNDVYSGVSLKATTR